VNRIPVIVDGRVPRGTQPAEPIASQFVASFAPRHGRIPTINRARRQQPVVLSPVAAP
jgi:hypothetical protein